MRDMARCDKRGHILQRYGSACPHPMTVVVISGAITGGVAQVMHPLDEQGSASGHSAIASRPRKAGARWHAACCYDHSSHNARVTSPSVAILEDVLDPGRLWNDRRMEIRYLAR